MNQEDMQEGEARRPWIHKLYFNGSGNHTLKWFPLFNRGYHNAQPAWGFIRSTLIVTVIDVIVVFMLLL